MLASHPASVLAQGNHDRASWTQAARNAVAPKEKKYTTITGYMVQARDEGPEGCNCGGLAGKDTHTWIVAHVGDLRAAKSVVAEVSPRMKGGHPNWKRSGFTPLINNHTKLRITGWLMWDQEHNSQVGHSRGSSWEIHPIHKIEYESSPGVWSNF